MKSFIIVDITMLNKEKLADYSAAAVNTFTQYSAEIVAKGPIEILHGTSEFHSKVVIQFPDKDSAVNWYKSPEYQKLISLRDQGMKSQFHLI